MIFTANKPQKLGGPGVDYRQWGGLNWWQNARSPYYSMLATGDQDLLATLFQSMNRSLPLARARVQTYFNFTGAYVDLSRADRLSLDWCGGEKRVGPCCRTPYPVSSLSLVRLTG